MNCVVAAKVGLGLSSAKHTARRARSVNCMRWLGRGDQPSSRCHAPAAGTRTELPSVLPSNSRPPRASAIRLLRSARAWRATAHRLRPLTSHPGDSSCSANVPAAGCLSITRVAALRRSRPQPVRFAVSRSRRCCLTDSRISCRARSWIVQPLQPGNAFPSEAKAGAHGQLHALVRRRHGADP